MRNVKNLNFALNIIDQTKRRKLQQSVAVLLNSHVPNHQIEIDPEQTQNNEPDKKQVTTGVPKRKTIIGEVFHTFVQTSPILYSSYPFLKY